MCIPAWLLDIHGYPEYEQVLGPAVILGLGSVELFLKKKELIIFTRLVGGFL